MISKLKKYLNLIFFILSSLVFVATLSRNSVPINIQNSEQSLEINMLGETIKLDNDYNDLNIALNAQQRYSTSQLLIQNDSYFKSSLIIIRALIFREKTLQPITINANEEIELIHFNPFRSSLVFSEKENTLYRFEINIPDSSLEIWQNNSNLENIKIQVPWIKLIITPLVNSVLITAMLFFFLQFIPHDRTIITNNYTKNKFLTSLYTLYNEHKIILTLIKKLIILLIIFIISALTVNVIFVKAFNTLPGFGDEMNYLIQAKIFSSGKIAVTQPELKEFFYVDWMHLFGRDGKVWNFHPFGYSLILALGWLINKPELVPPIVAGLIACGMFLLTKESFKFKHVPIITLVFMFSSHYFLSLASSYMAHALSMLLIISFYLIFTKFIKTQKNKYLVFMGLFFGLAFITRPVSAVLALFIPIIITAYKIIYKPTPKKFGYALLSASIALLISSSLFLFTYNLTGVFDFPYSVKGLESGITLTDRIERGWEFRLSNTFRNINEFQHRVHSFGYLLNLIPFILPAFVGVFTRFTYKKEIAVGYLVFIIFILGYSFIQFYGWKWEPRMIYDISFLYYLLSGFGLYYILAKLNQSRSFICLSKLLIIFVLGWLVSIDLPTRFQTEYRNYNLSSPEIKESIDKNKISNAIIFFPNPTLYASYSPYNSLSYDSDIIYAISQGKIADFELISNFPNKNVYYVKQNNNLIQEPNILNQLNNLIEEVRSVQTNNSVDKTIFIINVSKFITNESLHPFSDLGEIMDESAFINWYNDQVDYDSKILIVELNNSQNESRRFLTDALFEKSVKENILSELIPSVRYFVVEKNKNMEITDQQNSRIGLFMECYENTNWSGQPYIESTVAEINASQCLKENTSIRWSTYISSNTVDKVDLLTQADDGQLIMINDNVVVERLTFDENKTKSIFQVDNLIESTHKLEFYYVNVNGEGYLNFYNTSGDLVEFGITYPGIILSTNDDEK